MPTRKRTATSKVDTDMNATTPARLISRTTRAAASSKMPSITSVNRTKRGKASSAIPAADISASTVGDSDPKVDTIQASTKTPTKRRRISKPVLETSSTPIKIVHHSQPCTVPLLPGTLSFDLQTAISHLKDHDSRFGPLFSHLPCRPFVPPYLPIDPFKTLVTSIIGQQVSWMAARAINGRFRGLWGYGDDGFPTPQEVAVGEVMVLKSAGLSTRKAEYVIALAQHFVSGQLSTELLRDGSDEEVSKALIAVRGIGQWTVDMFLIFSLRRPDVLPVGDLGVQKGLLKWALAAHGALPKSKPKTPVKGKKAQKPAVVVDQVDGKGDGEIDTLVKNDRPATPDPTSSTNDLPPTPYTPSTMTQPPKVATIHTPNGASDGYKIPPTPSTPSTQVVTETLEVPAKNLPPPAPDFFLSPPDHPGWDQHRSVPLAGEGLSVEVLKSRLAGKKAKGGMYLTPKEMEVLTEGWKPYRSLGVIYTWSVAEDL